MSDEQIDYQALLYGYVRMITRREGVTLCQYNGGDLTKEQCNITEKIADEVGRDY